MIEANKIHGTEESKKNHPLSMILKNHPEFSAPIKENDVHEVRLLKKTSKEVYFDLGSRGTAVVYGAELLNARDIIRNLEPGDACTATITLNENEDGLVEISLKKALWQQSWQEIKRLKESGEIITAKINGANTGGLVAEISGIKAFLPVSQLSAQNYPHVEDGNKNKILDELKKFICQEIGVKVLDFNPKNNKLIISEKEVTGEGVKKSLEKYAVGDTVEVMVSGIADFGVFVRFVDDPSIEGLVHISEIDHKLIGSPKEVVKINDSLKAKIIEEKDGKVSLSFKALSANPWDDAEKHFAVDQEIKGIITRFNPFGALVTLGHDLQGLIHISEFESQEKMREQLKEEKEYTFVISQLKPAEKRIILKLKK